MLEYIRINTVAESDIDQIISAAGGTRVVCNGPNKPQNADYSLDEAIVELKLIEEEGLNKAERRRRITELFQPTQPERPVVVVDPALLSPESNRRYYNLLARPIQTAIRKAASQLEETRRYTCPSATRVLLILNNGYSALSPEEFKSLTLKSLRHDTSKIDHAVVAGVYYYSDTFDSYVIAHFEHVPINIDRPFPSYGALLDSWNQWLHKFMTEMVVRESVDPTGKFPVVDLKFEVEGITYLKPAPPIGAPSNFWPGGKRPRTNSTGIESCPPVAVCFPRVTEPEWEGLRDLIVDRDRLRHSYAQWMQFKSKAKAESTEPLIPFVEVDVTADDFARWVMLGQREKTFKSLTDYAVELFQQQITEMIENAKDITETKVHPAKYVFLLVDELGQDKADDISSIYLVSTVPGGEREVPILENKRIFFEYSLAVAAAYAVQEDIPFVYYEIDRTYGWI